MLNYTPWREQWAAQRAGDDPEDRPELRFFVDREATVNLLRPAIGAVEAGDSLGPPGSVLLAGFDVGEISIESWWLVLVARLAVRPHSWNLALGADGGLHELLDRNGRPPYPPFDLVGLFDRLETEAEARAGADRP